MIFAMFTAAAAAAVATSATPAVAADLRCFAAVAATLTRAPDTERAGLIGGVMYFMGRIDAAAPGLDYHAEFTAMMKADPDAKSLDAELPRCTAIMKDRGARLVAIGESMQANAGQ